MGRSDVFLRHRAHQRGVQTAAEEGKPTLASDTRRFLIAGDQLFPDCCAQNGIQIVRHTSLTAVMSR